MTDDDTRSSEFAIAIHGGAGTILKANLTDQLETDYRRMLRESLAAGYAVLEGGGTSLDAVQKAINVMEDSPLFNAGKGAVFAHEGINEQDACIMDGATLEVGAIAGVRRIRNPIDLARLVMEKSPHVLLAEEGAEEFAVSMGMTLMDAEYFYTERRWNQLQNALAKERETGEQFDESNLDHSAEGKHGTVGAVALDRRGNLAAATSTGGMTNKRYHRIGDSPIVGAGTYANNATCAVSTTGQGEYFMRLVTAYDISALMEYKGFSLTHAAGLAIQKLTELKGSGGLIAIDRKGHIVMPFNSEGMYRGFRYPGEKPVVKIFDEDD
jgi:beta-aspartyl-peptidase (threonine type)